MQRILSTYPFVTRKLTPELLGQISKAGFQGVEIFFSRAHFDYTAKPEIRAMAGALEANKLALLSIHAPSSRDLGPNREGGAPLSICEVERVRRIDAMDELKRAIDVAEDLPFQRMVLHMGGSRETPDPRKRDAAFSSLEHLILHARHVGVTITVENTTSEMGEPAYLRAFVDETRLTGLRFNFDIGHANLTEVNPSSGHDSRILCAFEPLRDSLAAVHLHDNHGEKDEHLPPYEGSIDWPTAISMLKTAPNAATLPLTLELKERSGTDAPSTPELLAAARSSLDLFEKAWAS
jgi:sugar phosphate isomerase/epimerase